VGAYVDFANWIRLLLEWSSCFYQTQLSRTDLAWGWKHTQLPKHCVLFRITNDAYNPETQQL